MVGRKQHLTMESDRESQPEQSLSQDSNPRTPEYETGMLFSTHSSYYATTSKCQYQEMDMYLHKGGYATETVSDKGDRCNCTHVQHISNRIRFCPVPQANGVTRYRTEI